MIRDTYATLFLDAEKTKQLITEVLNKGYAALPNFFDDVTWSELSRLAESRTIGNKKTDELRGTIAYDIAVSDEMFNLCDLIHKTRCDIERTIYGPLRREKQKVGFPYKDAQGGAETRETEYHYDGAYINIVVPIMLPTDKKDGGDLIMFPNLRKRFSPIVCKPLSELLRRFAFMREWFGYTKVSYDVGTFYLFFGDISLHGVPPITAGERLVMTVNSHW
jgi:hypothetical protein